MKLKLFYLLIAIFGLTSFFACSDDDDDNKLPQVNIPEAVSNAFKTKYPGVDINTVKWETKGKYMVGDFKQVNNMEEVEAWFDATKGDWAMTETDYGKDIFLIPTEINLAFNKTEYAQWTIDDIKYYEYPDTTKNFYMIEVEKAGQQDMDLYFKPDGTSIKNVASTGVDITPDTVI